MIGVHKHVWHKMIQQRQKIRGTGGTQKGHTMKELDDSDVLGKPGDFIDPELKANRLLPYPNNLTYKGHEICTGSKGMLHSLGPRKYQQDALTPQSVWKTQSV